jgi:hypothetical protein
MFGIWLGFAIYLKFGAWNSEFKRICFWKRRFIKSIRLL